MINKLIPVLLLVILSVALISAQETQADIDRKLLKVLKELAIKSIKQHIPVNLPQSDIAELEADFRLGNQLRNALPYIKVGIKTHLMNGYHKLNDEQSDLQLKDLLQAVMPYIKSGVKDYILTVLSSGKPEEEAEQADSIALNEETTFADENIWNVLKEIAKAAIGEFLNKNNTTAQPAPAADLKFKADILPYLKAGVKDWISTSWDASEVNADIPIRSIIAGIQLGLKGYDHGKQVKLWKQIVQSDKEGFSWKNLLEGSKLGLWVKQNIIDKDVKGEKVWDNILPFLKAGVKDFVSKNWGEKLQADIPIGTIIAGIQLGSKGYKYGKQKGWWDQIAQGDSGIWKDIAHGFKLGEFITEKYLSNPSDVEIKKVKALEPQNDVKKVVKKVVKKQIKKQLKKEDRDIKSLRKLYKRVKTLNKLTKLSLEDQIEEEADKLWVEARKYLYSLSDSVSCRKNCDSVYGTETAEAETCYTKCKYGYGK
ncbi:hypothetical protein ABK040_000620 [Willaertia magna]